MLCVLAWRSLGVNCGIAFACKFGRKWQFLALRSGCYVGIAKKCGILKLRFKRLF
ncbi:hypothetical protein [Helicobacter rodentium]|uniref:hypothetical protein n=1 Tax=Helicobacter rodentium TaxID=59617 RepID=UPI002354F6EC|nr:hypothetical protein [Helicobacter rodentium]